MLAEQKIPEHFGEPCFEDIPDRLEVAKALGHLFRVDLHEGVVHPVFGKLAVAARFCLSDFVFVVGEDKIHAAAVDVQGQVGFGHGRALDVPAGAAIAPREGQNGSPGLAAFQSAKSSGFSLMSLTSMRAPDCRSSIGWWLSLP